MPHPLPPPRWQRRAEARPQELLEAALTEFVARGYAATRLDEVARRAGVSKGTLYLYYENKAELFKAVVRRALVGNLDEAEARVAGHAGSSRDLLAWMLTEMTRRVSNSELSGIPKLVISEAGNFPEIARFYFDEVIRRGRDIVQGILRRGMDSGEFRPVDPEYAWRVIIAPVMLGILWKHSFMAVDPHGLDFERHLRSHLDLLFDGLSAPGRKRTEETP
ncbi:MAG TPA: TetR/AcrR family transcriptional regulator [Thiobacillaceae bacterium]|nr:TetR/AcrR family transcriptional regulator [Thiobacillaceae bacterium]